MAKKILISILVALAAVLVFGQLIRPARTNPPVDPTRTFEARLAPPPDVAKLVATSCGDCHSHHTVWPWYSQVAPVMWLVVSDVNEGRRDLDFSDWARFPPDRARRKLGQVCREVREGDMPPWYYTVIHKGTRLSPAQRQTLCDFTAAAAATQN